MKTVILCYHKIGDEETEGRWLNCHPQTLRSHCRFFARRKVPGFLPRDFVTSRPSGVCFTFDDAYVSAVSASPSILEENGFRGAYYAVPSLVGQSSVWDGERAVSLATWGELHDLIRRGHEIGNHTMTHARLGNLDFEAQKAELESAQKKLHEMGIDSQSLCFPYGSYNDETLRVMRELGVKVGLRLGKRPVGNETPDALNRVIVAYSDTLPKLLYKIHLRPLLP